MKDMAAAAGFMKFGSRGCMHAPCHFGTCWLEKHLPMLNIKLMPMGGMKVCLILAILQVFSHSLVIS